MNPVNQQSNCFRSLKIPDRFASGAALVVLSLWAFWLALPFFAFSDRSFVRINDNGDANLPMALAAQTDLGDPLIGARNATLVCGFNQTANWGWTPLDTFFAVLPGWAAYAAITFLQRLVAALGTFFLARRTLGAGALSATLAGVGYSLFCQFFLNDSWSGFTYNDSLARPAIPLVLLSLSTACRWASAAGKTGAAFALAAATGALYGICGSYLSQTFVLALTAAWVLILFPEARFRKVVPLLAVFGAAWLVVVMPFARAALMLAADSHRTDTLESLAPDTAIASAWNMLKRSYFDNWPFAIAMVAGLFVPPWRDRRMAKLVLTTAACWVLVLFSKALTIAFRDALGFLQSFQFQRFYLLLPFLYAFAGSEALARVSSWLGGLSRRWPRPLGCLAIAAVFCWAGQRSRGMHHIIMKTVIDGWCWTVFTDPDLKGLRDRTAPEARSDPFRVVTVANTGTSIWHPDMMPPYGFEAADGYVPLYAGRYHDFWARAISPHLERSEKLASYFHTWGNRAYVFGPETGWPADGAPVPAASLASLDLLSLANVRFVFSPAPLSDPGLKPVVERPPSTPPKSYRRKLGSRIETMWAGYEPRAGLWIYENRNVLPRFYFADRISVFDGDDETLQALSAWKNAGDDTRPAFLNRADLGDQPVPDPAGGTGRVEIRRLTADAIDLSVSAKDREVLVIGNSYERFWEARIDGEATAIFPANHAFQGIVVPAGDHAVELRYRGPRHPMVVTTMP